MRRRSMTSCWVTTQTYVLGTAAWCEEWSHFSSNAKKQIWRSAALMRCGYNLQPHVVVLGWMILMWLMLVSTVVCCMRQQHLWRPLMWHLSHPLCWVWNTLPLLIEHGHSCRKQCMRCLIGMIECHPRFSNSSLTWVLREQLLNNCHLFGFFGDSLSVVWHYLG